ncbi:MAG: nitrilase-related carbon-nitrogen hydrolase [Pirellulaceae bacterium]
MNQGTSSDRRQLRIALAQTAPLLGDRSRNLQHHATQIEAARAAEADLVVFPELSLTGYFLRDMVPDVSLSVAAAEIDKLAAHSGDMDLVFGFVEQSGDYHFYNSAAYAEGGAVRHVHRKVYLPTYGLFDEQRYFAAGRRIRAFDTKRFGRVGLLICEDLWHLSAAAIMQAEEVNLLICVANSPARGVQGDDVRTASIYGHVCRTYARLLGAIVVLVNRVGFEDGLCFWGGSMVVGPGGDLLAQAPQLDESLTVATLDLADLRRERIITPLGRDAQLLLTLEELKRIKRRRYEE